MTKRYRNLTLKPREAKWRVFEDCDTHFNENDTCEGCRYHRGGDCRQADLLEKLEDEIRELRASAEKYVEDLGFIPGSKSFKAGMVLFGSAVYGTNVYRISKWSGIPEKFIRKLEPVLQSNGIWKDGEVYADWMDEKNGGLAFILDTFAAVGMVERHGDVAPTPET